MGCLFLKLVEEGAASPANLFPREPAGETTSAGTGRVPMAAPLRLFRLPALNYQFTQVFSKVLGKKFSGEKLRNGVEDYMGSGH